MDKLSAFFQTENDAVDVQAKLQALKVENLTVEQVPEDHTGILDTLREVMHAGNDESEHDPYKVLFEVAEEDSNRALAIIEENGGYIEE
ncbi:hypothetical protein KO561_15960 [Radiobacillus kanasensis]|uniref:hypothetical protein n=1 Tax=Radiobacillus kanasensis TaxID=2844358 RepID=UPI001E4AD61E|nr:hypothetical protein [Radiobacillus kanasensis]UFT98675.1 hypothetical protein KO561_15960 [Radiobacillus kanasensis]